MKYIEKKDYILNKYHVQLINNKFLITVEWGDWVFLNKEQFKKFKFGVLDDDLFFYLENNRIIITKNNKNDITKVYKQRKWHVGNGPSLHIIVPTLRCNHTCVYCYASRRPLDDTKVDMTEEIADKTADFIMSVPAQDIVLEFTGGEPLVRFDIIKRIILRAKQINKELKKNNLPKKKLGFAIVTNGTYFNDEMIDFIKKHQVGVCFSLDGPKFVHDYHRKFLLKPKESTYDVVIQKMNYLKDNGINGIRALPVITKYSIKYWKEIIEEYLKHNIWGVRFKYAGYFGFAVSSWNKLHVPADEFVFYWKKVIDYMLKKNDEGTIVYENMANMLISKILLRVNPGFAEMDMPCGATTGQIVYNYDGKIFSCDEARTMPELALGDVRTNNLFDVMNNSVAKCLTKNSLHTNYNCDDCVYQPFCGFCPLEQYHMTKTFITNMPRNYRCQINKGMMEYFFKLIQDDNKRKNLLKWNLWDMIYY